MTYNSRKPILVLSFLLLTFFFIKSDATELVKIKSEVKGHTFFVLYGEEEKFFVSQFYLPDIGMQELVSQKTFIDEYDAKDYFDSVTHGFKNLGSRRFSGIHSEVFDETIWPITQSWSIEWETKYSEWVEQNVDRDFFVKYNLATDCADVAVALRWIFARINGLPMVNHLAASGVVFSHATMKSTWKNLPTNELWFKDQRFLTALNYVLEMTYTHTLFSDSYPIQITSQTVTAGSHYLYISGRSGHTIFFRDTDYNYQSDRFLTVIFSDVPREVRSLYEEAFYIYSQPKLHEEGLLKIRWPQLENGQWELVAPEQMAFFSLEQFDSKFMNGAHSFDEAILRKIMGSNYDPVKQFKNLQKIISDRFNARVKIVEDGYNYCSRNGCPRQSQAYEDHSTFSRDEKLLRLVRSLNEAYYLYYEYYPEISDLWEQYQAKVIVKVSGQDLKFEYLYEIWTGLYYSSEPNDSVKKRWGLYY